MPKNGQQKNTQRHPRDTSRGEFVHDWLQGAIRDGDFQPGSRIREAEVALELAREVLQGAPQSVRAGRETVMLATQMGRSAALEAARHASEWTYRCEDAQEGPRAFAEKRAPVWTSFD